MFGAIKLFNKFFWNLKVKILKSKTLHLESAQFFDIWSHRILILKGFEEFSEAT